MQKYTLEQLKQLVRKTTVAEVLSALELKLVKHAIYIGKKKDLVEIADLAQNHSGSKDERLKKLLLDNTLQLFYTVNECPAPQNAELIGLQIDDIWLVKKAKY